jgi:uncharacterized protein YkuJ
MTLKEIATRAFEYFENVEIQDIDVSFTHKGNRYSLMYFEHSGIYFLTKYYSENNTHVFELTSIEECFDLIIIDEP